MLQSIQNQRVHVLNLGFEHDWILKSFAISRPDKIYLIRKTSEDEKAEKVEVKIKDFSKKNNIQLETIKLDGDIYKLILEVRKIIQKECKNFVYLSISSGQRDNISAFILSSMLFSKEAKSVYLYSLKDGNFIELPHFEVKLPKQEVIEAIKYIGSVGKCIKNDLRKHMFENKHLRIEKKSKFVGHNEFIKLNRAVLDPALEWNLINVEGKRKGSRIMLTEEGEKWFKIF